LKATFGDLFTFRPLQGHAPTKRGSPSFRAVRACEWFQSSESESESAGNGCVTVDMCESESRWENLDHDHDGDQVKVDQTEWVVGLFFLGSDTIRFDSAACRPMSCQLLRSDCCCWTILLAWFVQPAIF